MEYVKNLNTDEIRSGFLVTSDRKRLWNAQINLIVEFQKFCDKHGLRFWAHCGTLLGAVRHQGFVPWDDDVDIAMFRDDYEKLKTIAPKEFHYPYVYNIGHDNDDPDYTEECGWPFVPLARVTDERSFVYDDANQGRSHGVVSIDFFPLTVIPSEEDHPDQEQQRNFELIRELHLVACMPKRAKFLLDHPEKYPFIINLDQLRRISQMPLRQRGKIFEDYLIKGEFDSKIVQAYDGGGYYRREWFNETIYLPFENISVPCPKEYAKVLTAAYGNWQEEKITHTHTSAYSLDFTPDEYYSKRDRPDNVETRENSLRQDFYHAEMRNGKLVMFNQKKFWKVQLDLIDQLKNISEKHGLKFFAVNETLYSAVNIHGFNPENDYVQFGMSREDFEKFSKVETNFPYRFESGKLSDDRTCFIEKPDEKNIPQGIYIEIVPVENVPNEIVCLPFEFTSIPVPKNFEELLKDFEPNFRKFSGDVSADISYREIFKQVRKYSVEMTHFADFFKGAAYEN